MRALNLFVLLASLPAAARVTVAVMYFDNHSNLREYDVLSKGMADMLITDLAGAEQLDLVERAKLEAVISEIGLQRSKYFDPESAVKVGKLLGAHYAVTGAFTGFEPEVRILGISERVKADTEALATCKASDEVVDREIDRVIDAEGPAGVETRLKAIEGKCAPLATQIRSDATWGLLMRADCASAKKYAPADEDKTAVAALCD